MLRVLMTMLTWQWPFQPLEHILLTHGIEDRETPGQEPIGLQGPGCGLLVMNTQNLKENILRKLLQQKNLLHLNHKHKHHQQQKDTGAKEPDGKTAQHLCLGLQATYLKDLGVLQHNSSLLCRSPLLRHSHLPHSGCLQRKIHGKRISQVDERRGV